MSIKGKPPISEDDFIRATPATEDEPGTITIQIKAPRHRVQKLFHLRWDVCAALKVRALQESEQQDRRVSEASIVETLLKEYLGIK